jgi:hypothetical protein
MSFKSSKESFMNFSSAKTLITLLKKINLDTQYSLDLFQTFSRVSIMY